MTSSCRGFIWLLNISNRIFLSGTYLELWHVKWSGGWFHPPPYQTLAVNDLYRRRVNSSFDVELISKVIFDLECGKAPGLDELSVEHLLYAHPSVVIILSKLFELIVTHNVVPDRFRSNYIIPLPKITGRSKSLTCNDFGVNNFYCVMTMCVFVYSACFYTT